MKTKLIASFAIGIAIWVATTDRALEIVGEALTAIGNGIDKHRL